MFINRYSLLRVHNIVCKDKLWGSMDKNIGEWEKLRRRPPYLALPPKIFKRGLKFPIWRTINSTIFGLLMINHAQGLMSIKNKSYLPVSSTLLYTLHMNVCPRPEEKLHLSSLDTRSLQSIWPHTHIVIFSFFLQYSWSCKFLAATISTMNIHWLWSLCG